MRSLCALLVVVVVCHQAANAQTPSDQSTAEVTTQTGTATFQSGVNLVLVPVVVRDQHGHAIGDLKKDDFRVFDKGKPQVISRFSIEKHVSEPQAAQEKTASTESTGENAGGSQNSAAAIPERFVAYLFDDLHTSFGDLARVQKAAVHHLNTALQPTDRAAIYTTSGQGNLDFTDDRAKLQEAVMKLRVRDMFRQQSSDCPYMNYYIADQIVNKNNQDLLQVLTNDTIICANLQQQQTSGRGGQGGGQRSGAQQTAQSMVQSAAQTMIPMGEQDARVSLSVFKDVVRRLSAMPGQRLIVAASPGFLTVSPESFAEKNEILDRAAHSNVVISAVDARGLWTDSQFDASQTGTATSQLAIRKGQYLHEADMVQSDILAELADGTGGTFFQNSNDLEAGFRRVAAAPEYVYVLGFSPQNLKMDGTFHKLKVNVPDGKGLSVQARRGYYTSKHATSAEENAKAEIQDAVFSREEIHDIPVDLHTQFFKPDAANAKLTVLARVDLKRIRFKKVDGRNRNDLTVVAALFDRNGNFVTGNRQTVEMRLKDETLARASSGLTVRSNFDVKPGTYVVRLVVRDTEGQLMSAQNGAVEIP